MRLIDADEMLNHIGAVYTAASRHREYGYKEIMQEMRQRARHSQVEAIPIEWIERKIKESLYDRYASYEDIAAQIDTNTMMKSWAILIERWEKENGS